MKCFIIEWKGKKKKDRERRKKKKRESATNTIKKESGKAFPN